MLYVYAQKQILINFNNMTCWLNSFEIHANFYHCTLQCYIFIIYIQKKYNSNNPTFNNPPYLV